MPLLAGMYAIPR